MTNPQKNNKLDPAVVQKLVLGLIVLAAVGYAVWAFQIAPLQEKQTKLTEELTAARSALETNKKLIATKTGTMTQYEASRKEMLKLIQTLPPSANELAWGGDLFRSISQTCGNGVKPRTVSIGGVNMSTITGREATPPLLEEMMFRVDFNCGYHEFGTYLATVEKCNPYLRLDALEIMTESNANAEVAKNASSEDKRIVTITVDMLRFTNKGFLPEERPDAPTPHVVTADQRAKAVAP